MWVLFSCFIESFVTLGTAYQVIPPWALVCDWLVFFSFFAAMGWFCYVLITIKDALTVAGHPEKPTVQVGFALLQTTVSAKFKTDSVGFIHYDPLDALCFIFNDFSPKQTLLNPNSGYAFNGPLVHLWSERFVQHFVTSHYFFQLGNKTKNQKKKDLLENNPFKCYSKRKRKKGIQLTVLLNDTLVNSSPFFFFFPFIHGSSQILPLWVCQNKVQHSNK